MHRSIGVVVVLISLFETIEPIGRYTSESVTCGRCSAKLMVTFPGAQICHSSLAGTDFSMEGRRLSWPDWLYQDSIPVNGHTSQY